jgi:hypothetical protein
VPPWAGIGAVVRLGWLPAKLAGLRLVRDVQQITAGGITMADAWARDCFASTRMCGLKRRR